MKQAVILVALIALQGCAVLASPDDWSDDDTKYEMMWQVMNVIDARQTARIQDTPGVYEADWMSRPLIGLQPSTRDAYQLLATYAVSHYLISKYLPKKLRPYWHAGMIIGKYEAVQNNHENGLGY